MPFFETKKKIESDTTVVGRFKILIGDVRERLKDIPDESVQCCVTSPPYWGLRDYGTGTWEGGDPDCDHVKKKARNDADSEFRPGTDEPARIQYSDICGKCGAKRIDKQIGLEPTPEEYVAVMVEVFREVRRVLREDGVCWLNLGDSYTAGAGNRNGLNATTLEGGHDYGRGCMGPNPIPGMSSGVKPKDLVGIPWMVAFALCADGWYLRQDIIWAKNSPMPESVTDRCTKSHEYIFLLAKSQRYFYDHEAIKEGSVDPESHRGRGKRNEDRFVGQRFSETRGGFSKIEEGTTYPTRNRRSVWTINPRPYEEAHFATFPVDLVIPCIKAGTSERGKCPHCGKPWKRVVERSGQMPCKEYAGDDLELLRRSNNDADRRRQLSGAKQAAWKAENPDRFFGWHPQCTCPEHKPIPCLVLDPFLGSGTTLQVARWLGRNGIGIELNGEYASLAKERIMKPPQE